jgi:uncharacterized protein (UPF0335 family)
MENKMSIAAEQLRLFLERIERLQEEKDEKSQGMKDVFSEAKSQGYDTKVMRDVLRLRRMEKNDRQEWEAILDTYKTALGL